MKTIKIHEETPEYIAELVEEMYSVVNGGYCVYPDAVVKPCHRYGCCDDCRMGYMEKKLTELIGVPPGSEAEVWNEVSAVWD